MEVKESLDKVWPEFASERNITWNTIPQASPHMGGLWEAGVKSAKLHLKKCLGKTVLNFEELYTLVCDIEAVLNWRPLVAVSNDPNDLRALTPNMLLTGREFLSMPLAEEGIFATSDFGMHPTRRWEHVNNLAAMFWRRWRMEYVSTLQPRTKWAKEER
jgi:hypothetical protein